jgi:hypothetical protein
LSKIENDRPANADALATMFVETGGEKQRCHSGAVPGARMRKSRA